jgi:hypothetical protein
LYTGVPNSRTSACTFVKASNLVSVILFLSLRSLMLPYCIGCGNVTSTSEIRAIVLLLPIR